MGKVSSVSSIDLSPSASAVHVLSIVTPTTGGMVMDEHDHEPAVHAAEMPPVRNVFHVTAGSAQNVGGAEIVRGNTENIAMNKALLDEPDESDEDGEDMDGPQDFSARPSHVTQY